MSIFLAKKCFLSKYTLVPMDLIFFNFLSNFTDLITKNAKEALISFFDYLSKYYLSRKLLLDDHCMYRYMVLKFLLEKIKKIPQLEHSFHNFCYDCYLVYSSEKFEFIIPCYNFNIEDNIRTLEDESVVNLRRRLNSSRRSRSQLNETQIKGDATQEETGLLYPVGITNITDMTNNIATKASLCTLLYPVGITNITDMTNNIATKVSLCTWAVKINVKFIRLMSGHFILCHHICSLL